NGFSVRQFLIKLSENHMKPLYGQDFFARCLVYRALAPHAERNKIIIVDDCGFETEAAACDNRYVIRLVREGCNFANDSRSYLKHFDHICFNDRTLADLQIQAG